MRTISPRGLERRGVGHGGPPWKVNHWSQPRGYNSKGGSQQKPLPAAMGGRAHGRVQGKATRQDQAARCAGWSETTNPALGPRRRHL